MMNFWQRLQVASQLLFKQQVAYNIAPTGGLTPYYDKVTFEGAIKEGLTKNELIFACSTLIADSAAQARLCVYNKADEVEYKEHPLVTLLDRPNPALTQSDMLGMVSLHVMLAGVSYWEKVRSRGGQVVQLWPLRPDWIEPIIGSKGYLDSYKYSIPGRSAILFQARDILAFRNIHPMDMYSGLPPIQAAARVGQTDNSTSAFLTALMQNGGVPIGLLKTKMTNLNAELRDKIRGQWRDIYGGSTKWTVPAVLDADLEYQKTGFNLEELGFEALDSRNEARICAVFRVPPILVGAKIGLDRSTFSNYAEARTAFWQETMMPQFRRLRSSMNIGLAPDFGPDIDIRTDFSEVPALTEDRNSAWTRAVSGINAGAITVNQFLEEIGEEAAGKQGDIYLRPMTIQSVPFNASGAMPEEPDNPSLDVEDEEIDDTQADGGSKALAVPTNAPDDKARRKFEKTIKAALMKHFEAELNAIGKAVKSGAR